MKRAKVELKEKRGGKNFSRKLEAAKKKIPDLLRVGVVGLAEEFIDDLIGRIERQDFTWPPLTQEYLEQKRKAGLDGRTLIATGDYVTGISVTFVDPKAARVQVGVEERDHISGVPLEKLARWLEFGTSKSPARPHWRPLMEEYRAKSREIQKKLSEDVLKQLREEIEKG